MPWIEMIDPEDASGLRKGLVRLVERMYGGVLPGIFRILLVDLQLFTAMGWLYGHLHLRQSSSLTATQKEMLATVVNGRVDGAP